MIGWAIEKLLFWFEVSVSQQDWDIWDSYFKLIAGEFMTMIKNLCSFKMSFPLIFSFFIVDYLEVKENNLFFSKMHCQVYSEALILKPAFLKVVLMRWLRPSMMDT